MKTTVLSLVEWLLHQHTVTTEGTQRGRRLSMNGTRHPRRKTRRSGGWATRWSVVGLDGPRTVVSRPRLVYGSPPCPVASSTQQETVSSRHRGGLNILSTIPYPPSGSLFLTREFFDTSRKDLLVSHQESLVQIEKVCLGPVHTPRRHLDTTTETTRKGVQEKTPQALYFFHVEERHLAGVRE